MQALPVGGAMASIAAPEAEVAAAVARVAASGVPLSVAAINTPDDIVIAGPADSVAEVRRSFEAQGRRTQELRVSHAFHSPLMRPMVEAFAEVAAKVAYRPALLPMVSTVSGAKAGPSDLASAAYWAGQVEAPVRFAAAARTLAEDGVTMFLEIGAAPILTALARTSVEAEGRVFLPSLTRPAAGAVPDPDADHRALALALAALYAHGAEIDWAGRDAAFNCRRVAFPGYPFQRKSYYVSPVRGGGPIAPTAAPIAAAPFVLAPSAPLAVGQSRDGMVRIIDEIARKVLSDRPLAPLDPDRALGEQGFTSLLALELRRQLDLAFEARLPATFFFNYPSICRMADYFLAEPSPSAPPPVGATPPAAPPDAASKSAGFDFLDDLSPDELEQLIEREVNLL